MKFIKQLILALLAYLLTLPIEIATFIVVCFKYGKGALNYFDDAGYNMDVHSAGRNRSLWNFLFIKKGGQTFTENTDMSISAYLGVNFLNRDLTRVGRIVYRFLYAIDRKNWKQGGHCVAAYNAYIEKHGFISHTVH